MLNEATKDPFQEIYRRLDALSEKISKASPTNSPVKSGAIASGSDATPLVLLNKDWRVSFVKRQWVSWLMAERFMNVKH